MLGGRGLEFFLQNVSFLFSLMCVNIVDICSSLGLWWRAYECLYAKP